MLPPRLAREIEELQTQYTVQVLEDPDTFNVIFSDFPTGPHYSHLTTTLLLRVPRAYPDAAMDMFWTDPVLTLADGANPQSGDQMEHHAGRQWRRFSWHHNGWPGGLQSLTAYLDFVRKRFNER